MTDEDEIKDIMRAALDRLRDDSRKFMSAKDQRIISIAERPTIEDVRIQHKAMRNAALVWPFAQAILACALLFAIFLIGIAVSLSGQPISSGLSFLAIIAAILILPAVAQMHFYARRL
ncbi:hypothetical protein [Paracoccus sp. Ld10]|uniref:hypothetical protein n=1 Tax=Paracoccus sp. Ld10 TaxID=649158 RepID=UPI00386DD604